MKFSVRQLIDEKEILSHLFLNCMTRENLKKIADRTVVTGEGSYSDLERNLVEIEVIIDGVPVNPRKFFDMFDDQYEKMIERKATELIKEKLTGKINSMIESLENANGILTCWANEITWDIKNPLL